MAIDARELHGAGHRILARLNAPRDAAGLAAFRVLFGALMVFAVARFVTNGWVEDLYLSPRFHFTYFGFDWVRPWPPSAMYAHFAVMGLAAFSLMLGAWTRISALIFFLTFTYAELIDKTAYLNHYYFVSLISLLLVFIPAGAVWSVDSIRARRKNDTAVGAWAYGLLRTQVGLVYFFAGLAKLNPDWLLRAEPLRTWLQAYTHLPALGSAIGQPWAAFAMSWAGALYDLTLVAFLLWRRTRPLAYATAVAFHIAIWSLFPIGVFSWVMLVSTTLFFEPDWPRKIRQRFRPAAKTEPSEPSCLQGRIARAGALLACVYLSAQLFIPLRFLLYPGDVNWTEQGFRFAWRVMLVEKSGQVELEVVTEQPERRFVIYPRAELTRLQYKMMSTQPDMIQEFAHHLGERFRQEGYRNVRVYAHAWAALHGRPSQRLIDPAVDLAAEPRSLLPKRWIVPLEPATTPAGHPNRFTSSGFTPSAASAATSFDR
jgi:hypothetical protein